MGGILARIASVSHRDDDTAEERRMKDTLIPVLWVMFVLLVAAVAGTLQNGVENWPDAVSIVFVTSALFVVLCALQMGVKPVPYAHAVVLMFSAVGLFWDWYAASTQRIRLWVIVVICLDAALVFNLDPRMTNVIVIATVLWLMLERAESVARFGMYDLWYDWDHGQDMPEVCDCASPPCALMATPAAMTSTIAVFLVDFVLTRRFASGMRAQMDIVAASVDTCQTVAWHLSRYEVDAARAVVAGGGGGRLPAELRESFEQLLVNLDSYRPYLPDSLLLRADCAEDDDECWESLADSDVAAPGEGETEVDVCICFTDIQSSTALWEAHHQSMYDALQLHNSLLRRAAAVERGYEVKTIGDAFMLAFPDVQSAARFALAVQCKLVEAEWPTDLMTAPLCSRVESDSGKALWNGLRVRIGVHCGRARVERNPVTRRCDYFGPVVNTAARIEAELKHGGLIGLSQEALDQVAGCDLGLPVLKPLGGRQLKGVAESVEITVMLPAGLQGRWDDVGSTNEGGDQSPRGGRQSVSSLSLRSAHSGDSRPGTHRSPFERRLSVASSAASRFGNRLALQLQPVSGTCVHVVLTLTESADLAWSVPVHVAALEQAADVTQGVVQTVLSGSAVVTWNAPRPCAGHTAQCAHFMMLLRNRGAAHGRRAWTGAASGRLLTGNIAGCRRRFATVIGGCVELAGHLAGLAETGMRSSLAVGPVADHWETRHRVTDVRTVSGQHFDVYSPDGGDDDQRSRVAADALVGRMLPPLPSIDATSAQGDAVSPVVADLR